METKNVCVDLWTQMCYKTARNPALEPNPMRFSSLLIVAIIAVCFSLSVEADAPPYFNEPTWNEKLPVATGRRSQEDNVAPETADGAPTAANLVTAGVVPIDDYTFKQMAHDLNRMLAFNAQ